MLAAQMPVGGGGGGVNFLVHVPPVQPPLPPGMPAGMGFPGNNRNNRHGRRDDSNNEYCALFVALIGEGADPQVGLSNPHFWGSGFFG